MSLVLISSVRCSTCEQNLWDRGGSVAALARTIYIVRGLTKRSFFHVSPGSPDFEKIDKLERVTCSPHCFVEEVPRDAYSSLLLSAGGAVFHYVV